MRKLTIPITLMLCALLYGCQYSEAKDAVKKLLNDPDSAKFSNLSAGRDKNDVCGFVNARNRMGGYVGDTPFVYQSIIKFAMMVQPPTDSDFRSLALTVHGSSGLFKEELNSIANKCFTAKQWEETCTAPLPTPKHELCEKIGAGLVDELQKRYE